MVLAFQTPALEKAFTQRWGASLVGQDISWAAFWTFMASGGLIKWMQYEEKNAEDLPAILAYLACGPILMCIIRLRPTWYVRHRVAVLSAVRLARTILFVSHMQQWEGVYTGRSATAPPSSAFDVFHHLSWRVFSLMLAGLGWVTPLRVLIPWLLTLLVLQLHATGQRCMAECGMGGGWAAAAAAPLGTCGLGAAGSCFPDEGVLQQTQQLYDQAMHFIRLAVPPAWPRLGAPAGCLPACFAVHGWLQAALGMMVTVAVVWVWEERLRLRELALWRESLQQQLALPGGPGTSKQQAGAPLSLVFAWCVGSASLLWMLLEALLLRPAVG